MEAFENMNKRTKIILSIVGIAAVVVPAILLMLTSTKSNQIPAIDSATRQIDQINTGEQKTPKPTAKPAPVTKTPPPESGGVESTPASR